MVRWIAAIANSADPHRSLSPKQTYFLSNLNGFKPNFNAAAAAVIQKLNNQSKWLCFWRALHQGGEKNNSELMLRKFRSEG